MYIDIFGKPHWTVTDSVLSNIYYPNSNKFNKNKKEEEVDVTLSINGEEYHSDSMSKIIDKLEKIMDNFEETHHKNTHKSFVFNNTKFTDTSNNKFTIKSVKFNPPATIIFWSDNTKTVVKACHDEPFDEEKGLAMAIIKKICGNKRDYYEIFKELCNE